MTVTREIAFLLLIASSVQAGVIHFEGRLDPALNSNLTFWDQSANAFGIPVAGPTDAERAFNVAVHTFVVNYPGTVTISSIGFGLGGFDSVLSVFSGTGLTAAYVSHASNPAVPGDFAFDVSLSAVQHTLTIGMFSNEPCAAGICPPVSGIFGDGFTNLVNFDPSRPDPLFYSVNLEIPTNPVPEPVCLFLAASGAVLLAVARRCARRLQ